MEDFDSEEIENIGSGSDEGDSESDADSDAELQKQFAKGELKPGLHKIVGMIRKEYVNNEASMKRKFEDFKLNIDWVERLDLSCDLAPLAPELAEQMQDKEEKVSQGKEEQIANDDFKRELIFYRQAQTAVLEAIPSLHKLGIGTIRPEDYFAQMAKSDDHMKKVREALVNKQVVMERREKAKKFREMKKYGKKVQQEVLQNRLKEKKEMLEKIKKIRKFKGHDNSNNEFDVEEIVSNPKKKTNNKKMQGNKNNKKFHRKEIKNKKFGFGGQKKRSKYNTSESTNDANSYKNYKERNSGRNSGKKGNKMQNMKKGHRRPGKMRRQNMKNKRK